MDKVQIAISRLQAFEPAEGYYLAFSGGKDSIVIKRLAIMAGVKFDAHYSLTTIDPPELVHFIKKHHADVIIDKPDMPFLEMLSTRGFPLRRGRWCCEEYKERGEEYKERGGEGRRVVTGIRWEESSKRAKRKYVETCYKVQKDYLHPIIDWTEQDVWTFIQTENLPYCKLYDRGWKRIGCLCCPKCYWKRRVREILNYPGHLKNYIRAFEKLHATGRKSMKRWSSGSEMFWWWVTDGYYNCKPDPLPNYKPRKERPRALKHEIWLPSLLPPSLNGWYAGGKGAAFKRAKVARQWHEYLAYLPEFRALPVFQNKIKIRVKLWFPNRIRRDHLNFSTPAIKFIEDTLVLMGKIADDSPEYMADSGMGQIMPVEKGKVGTLVTIEEV